MVPSPVLEPTEDEHETAIGAQLRGHPVRQPIRPAVDDVPAPVVAPDLPGLAGVEDAPVLRDDGFGGGADRRDRPPSGERLAVRPDHRELRASSLGVEGVRPQVLVPPADDGPVGREREVGRPGERRGPAGPEDARRDRRRGSRGRRRPPRSPFRRRRCRRARSSTRSGYPVARIGHPGTGRAADIDGAEEHPLVVDPARDVGDPIGADGEVLRPAPADEDPLGHPGCSAPPRRRGGAGSRCADPRGRPVRDATQPGDRTRRSSGMATDLAWPSPMRRRSDRERERVSRSGSAAWIPPASAWTGCRRTRRG